MAKDSKYGTADPNQPVARRCPDCRSSEYERVGGHVTDHMGQQRVCSNCGTRYRAPHSRLSVMIFLPPGAALTAVGGYLLYSRLLGFKLSGAILLLGLLFCAIGIQRFLWPGSIFTRTDLDAPKCPHCGQRLRSQNAKQCFHCGAAWHDADS
ncbi:MAG: hypothetical protein IH991_14350 [Planctomycetes bacterium]|nr:hypothetical protein [Planctomycetota bacterium]